MPQINEIRKGTEIGKPYASKFIWHACEDCGKERWVSYIKRGKILRNKICRTCSGNRRALAKSPAFIDGRTQNDGYIYIKVGHNDFFIAMAGKQRYIAEHRLVMAKHLGRCLHQWEIVHHKNGIRNDNRLENLELTLKGAHSREHNRGYRAGYQQGRHDGRLKQMVELKAQNAELLKNVKLLQFHIRELRLGIRNS